MARHMAEGDSPTSPARATILAFCSGVQLTAIRAVVLRFWLPLVLMGGSCGRIQPAYGWSGVQGRNAACAGPRGKAHGRWGFGGERSLPRSGGTGRARRPCRRGTRGGAPGPGGLSTGGGVTPLTKMSEPSGGRWRVEHAHILRAVSRRLFLCCSGLVFQCEGRRTNRE